MRAYLREHWRVIAAFFLFTAVFGVTFALYGLPLEAVAYPAGLCLLLGGLLALEDILRSRRKHRELVRRARTAPLSSPPCGGSWPGVRRKIRRSAGS